MNEEKYNKKINDINNIIKTIQSNRKNYPKRIDNNTNLSKDLNEMYISNKEKIKQIHNNENTIKELLKKLTENNEKIEVLNMQNKRITSEISSVEANIQNFEDTKKAHVAKKQFKDAQIANNEIKKCKESKAQLDVFLKGNLDEIEILNNDNKETNKSINNFNDEIKNCEKNIKEDNDKYLIYLLNILKQFIEDIEDNDPDKKMIQETIKLVTFEVYPNGEPEVEKIDEDNIETENEENKEKKENKENKKEEEEQKEKEEIIKEEENKEKENIEEKNIENKDENLDNNNKDKDEKEEKEEEKEKEKEESEEDRIKREEEEKIKKEKEINELKVEIEDLKQKLDALITEERYDECDTTNEKIEELEAKLKKLQE